MPDKENNSPKPDFDGNEHTSLYDYLYSNLVENRDKYLRYPARGLIKLGLSATQMNLGGMILAVFASFAIIRKSYKTALKATLLSAACDALDGPIARETQSASPWGAVIDATCDRVADLSFYFAIGIRSIIDRNYVLTIIAWFNLVSSTLTSYIRARAEASFVGKSFNVGVLPRPGRLIILLFGFKNPRHMSVILLISGVLSLITVFQRLHAVRRTYENEKRS